MAVSTEYLDTILRDWAENLWTANNAARLTDPAEQARVAREFQQKFYPPGYRGLGMGARMSERGFVGFCYGLAYMGSVAPKTADRLSNSPLVDAWRKSVWKNSFRQRFDAFAEILNETLEAGNGNTALDAYPAYAPAGEDAAAALDAAGYASSRIDNTAIKMLMEKVADRRAQGAGPPKGPAAPKSGA